MINIKNKLKLFPDALKLCSLFIENDAEIRFIGGAVRDLIANIAVSDIDLATNFTPDRVEELLKNNKIKYFSTGKIFGTITAIINNNNIEITTLRKDIICDGRHAQVQFSNDWQEDALRRDFTINALSCDLNGDVYDYFGGLEDLKQGKVRFIGKPQERITEDYLRILRFFRFSAYFAKEIDEQSLNACSEYANKFNQITINRFRAEIAKIFIAPNGLKMIKIMQEYKILPCSIDSIIYLENLYKLLKIFNYNHSELLSLSALLRKFNQPDFIIHNSAFSRHESKLLKKLVYSKITDFSYSNLKKLWQKYKDNFPQIILINLAVSYESLNDELLNNLKMLFSTPIKPLPIRGEDLLQLKIKPGKEMGNILAIAEDIWYNKKFNISKLELLNLIISK